MITVKLLYSTMISKFPDINQPKDQREVKNSFSDLVLEHLLSSTFYNLFYSSMSTYLRKSRLIGWFVGSGVLGTMKTQKHAGQGFTHSRVVTGNVLCFLFYQIWKSCGSTCYTSLPVYLLKSWTAGWMESSNTDFRTSIRSMHVRPVYPKPGSGVSLPSALHTGAFFQL